MKPIRLPPDPRVLVVALRRLGDVLLTTPLIRSVKRAYPAASIEALVFAGTEGILSGNPDLAGVLTMPERQSPRDALALLRRLWRLWGGPAGRWGGLLVVSALFGLVHCYQGMAAVISIGLMSILVGWFFMATGRIRALIVAHALFDSIQIVTVVVAIRQAAT